MFIQEMSHLVESYLANDGVVQNDEYVQLLNACLQDGVQDFELTAASQLLAQAEGISQQAAMQYQQAQQQLAYVQATAGNQGTVIDSRNPIPGVIGLLGVGIGMKQVSDARKVVENAERQYRFAMNRVTAYQTISNELSSRASMWTRFTAWING